MAQTQSTVESKINGDQLDASEVNNIVNTINNNATDAETRFAGNIGVTSIVGKSIDYNITSTGEDKDLGNNKFIYLNSSATADKAFTLPSTAGLSVTDSITLGNFNDTYALTVNLADGSDVINGKTGMITKTLVAGLSPFICFPVPDENTWVIR